MQVIVCENASPKLRGTLTRWFIQVKANVYVGNASKMVYYKLWEKVVIENTPAILIYTSNNEQGYKMKINGEPRRKIVEIDGLQLIKTDL